jgi:hypothetical protein
MKKLAFIILFTLSINAHSSETENTLKAASDFYEYITEHMLFTGLPNETHMSTLNNYISNELQSKLRNARKEQTEFIQNNKNKMKPPYIGGNMFGSLYEGIHKFTFGKYVINKDILVVPVYLEYSQRNDRIEWIDILVLKKQEGLWKVHNIKYSGTWAFMPSGSLLGNLPK